MRVVLSDNLTNFTLTFRRAIIRPDPPNNLSRRTRDDCDNVRQATRNDDILRMKSLIPVVVPAIGSEPGRRIYVQPVCAATPIVEVG